jgi:Nif11 domain
MNSEYLRFFADLKSDPAMQRELSEVASDIEAIATFAAARGYHIEHTSIAQNLGALIWIARVGEDIDHA